MDIKFKYDMGDMVRFTLTAFNSPKVYHGVISDRWGTIPHSIHDKVNIYSINCLEKGMTPFTISEILIIEKV